MLSKISRIKDFGVFKNFSGNTLPDFKTFNLIYGWNYSGKTTLSRIFRCLEKGKLHDDYAGAMFELLHPLGKFDNSFTNIPNIRVFNSDFIKENLKWDADKIEPILLLGAENIGLQKKLEDAEGKLREFDQKLTALKQSVEDTTAKQRRSLTDTARQILKQLSLQAFDRSHLVKLLDTIQPYDELNQVDFKRFNAQAVSTDEKPVIKAINSKFLNTEVEIVNVDGILQKQAASVQRIEKLISNEALSKWMEQGKSLHLDKKECEFCGGIIPSDLSDRLNKHFSKEYEQLKSTIETKLVDLEASRINLVKDLPVEQAFYNENITEYQLTRSVLEKEFEDFNKCINSFISDLKIKQNKPFDKMPISAVKINMSQLELALDNFNKVIKKNNDRTADFDKEKLAAKEKIKRHLAFEYEKSESYKATKKQIELDQNNIKTFQFDLEKQKTEILAIKAQLSVTIKGALTINNSLALFFSKDDIKIEATADNKFKLIRGNEVAKNLSEGEKTAISFVYFITKLEEQNNKLSETIVYIDDPISSLDSTHLFNIYSFIKNSFYEFKKNEAKQKIHSCKCKQLFISTHNFEFYNLVHDWYKSIPHAMINYITVERIKNPSKDESILKESSLLLQKYKSEYAYLFYKIYSFHIAPSDITESIYFLPNIMRKFIETFLNFKFLSAANLDDSIEKLITNPVDCERARKFMHYYSHSLTTESFMKFPDLTECSAAVRIVLEAIENNDPIHYKSLVEKAAA